MPPRKSEKVAEEARKTLEFVSQVESIIAEGPSRTKLSDYVTVVDLLLNAKTMFEKSQYSEGLVHVNGLLNTAMDDLGFAFEEMLRLRSSQAMAKLNKDSFKEGRSSRSDKGLESYDTSLSGRFSDDGAQSSSGVEGGTLELIPKASVKWLHEIAIRMYNAGVAARCAEIYRDERTKFVNACFLTQKTELITSMSLKDMLWEVLEKTCKEWAAQMHAVIGVHLKGEYDICIDVLDGLGLDQTRAFSGIVSGSFEPVIRGLCRVGRDIAAKRFPEQLFAMLDLFDTVDELSPHVRKIFADIGREDLILEFQTLPRLLAEAVMASFDQMSTMLKDIPEMKETGKQPQKMRFFKSSQQQPQVEINYDIIPKGGTVHPITSYVVNFVRGYLHRLGRRNYASILERVFQDHGSRRGEPSRTVDRETGLLVMSLCQSLEARGKFYKDDALQQLFMLNNINYLYRSMLLWHSWHGLGLQRAITTGQKEGNEELVRVLMDLQDDYVVAKYITKFQNTALLKIFSILGEPSPEVSANRGLSKLTESVAEVKAKLKKFTLAFEELCQQQSEWRIPDEELKVRIRGQWITIIKERHRRLLLSHWEELSTSKYFLRPEDIESRIINFFKE